MSKVMSIYESHLSLGQSPTCHSDHGGAFGQAHFVLGLTHVGATVGMRGLHDSQCLVVDASCASLFPSVGGHGKPRRFTEQTESVTLHNLQTRCKVADLWKS